MSRLVQLYNAPSIFSNTLAIYSLRKTKPSYSGSAVRVRCSYTGLTQDIGFASNGDLDIDGLRTCLGDSSLPLDIDSSAKAAYGLRKLKSSYSGNAIKVRRSSDNTLQDIGFDTYGNLDTASLKSFVGTGSGYIDTWYDQSGQGLNLTQATTAKQPRIVNTGVIDTKNGIPSVYFSGSSQNLTNTSVSGVISGSELRAFAVIDIESSSNVSGMLASLYKTGDANAYSTTTSMELLVLEGSLSYIGSNFNNSNIDTSWTSTVIPTGSLFQVTSYHDASNYAKIFLSGTNAGTNTLGLNLSPNSLMLGAGPSGTDSYQGYFSELIIYSSAVTTGNQSKIERNQNHYYQISGYTDGFVTTWYDQSGNGRNATQATTSAQPVITAVGVIAPNGTIKPAIQFDGSDDYLQTAASTAWPSGSSDRTMNAVFKLNATGSTYCVLGWGSIGSGTYSGLLHDPKVGFWGFNADVKGSTAADSNYGHRITITKSGSTTSVYRDGASEATGTPSLNTTSNTVLSFGRVSGGGNSFIGNIAEVVLYTTGLSSTERSQLEASQTTFYGQ